MYFHGNLRGDMDQNDDNGQKSRTGIPKKKAASDRSLAAFLET